MDYELLSFYRNNRFSQFDTRQSTPVFVFLMPLIKGRLGGGLLSYSASGSLAGGMDGTFRETE
jgi:hypothetical protein